MSVTVRPWIRLKIRNSARQPSAKTACCSAAIGTVMTVSESVPPNRTMSRPNHLFRIRGRRAIHSLRAGISLTGRPTRR